MTIAQKYLLEILKNVIQGASKPELPDNPDWNEFEKLCFDNSIVPMVFRMINSDLPSDRYDRWRNTAMVNNLYTLMLLKGASECVKLLEENGFDCILMKGPYLRYMYPYPQDRTMCDVDILVRENGLADIINLLLRSGYGIERQYEQGGAVYSVKEEKGTFIELHTCAIQPDEFKYAKNFIEPWERCQKRPDISDFGYFMSPEENFIHVIAHLAKHMEHHGAGIRYLCDVAVFVKHENTTLDWKRIHSRLDTVGLVHFTFHVLKAVEFAFGIDMPPDWPETDIKPNIAAALVEHMILCGTYGRGRMKNQFTSSIHRKEAGSLLIKKTKFIFRIIFPDYNVMKKRYRYLEKYPLLLPFSWFHRSFEDLFSRKSHTRYMFTQAKQAQKIINREETMFREFNFKRVFSKHPG